MPLTTILALVLTVNAQQVPDSTEVPVTVEGVREVTPAPTPMPTPTPRPTPKKSRKTQAKLSCSPHVSLSGGLAPSQITAFLYVESPGESLWCPGIEWYVGQDKKGTHESDCMPYQEVVAGEGEPERWTEDHPRLFQLWQGEHTIIAKLVKSGRVLARAECRVIVR